MRAIPRVSQFQFKYFQKLTKKKYREQEQRFLIEGTKLVHEVLQSDWKLETLLLHRDFLMTESAGEVLRLAQAVHCELLEVSSDELKKLSETVTPQGIVGVVVARPQFLDSALSAEAHRCLVVVLDDVADPGNVGTILRTCDWFGVDAVVLSKLSVEIFNPKVVRSAMGSLFHLPICIDADLSSFLKSAKTKGFEIIATAIEGGRMLPEINFPEKTIMVFGNEAHGVSPAIAQLADRLMTIPKHGRAESLNVAIASGVAIGYWRMTLSMQHAGATDRIR